MEIVHSSELIDRAFKRAHRDNKSCGLNKADAKRMSDALFDEVADIMAEGKEVVIRGFGKFYAKERETTNPIAYKEPDKGHPTKINAVVSKFVPGGVLKQKMKKAFGLA